MGGTLEKDNVETIAIAAQGIDIWNPAFDVTPAELIDGIITEIGVVEKDKNGRFDLEVLFQKCVPDSLARELDEEGPADDKDDLSFAKVDQSRMMDTDP